MKGYDADGITIHRSGPASNPGGDDRGNDSGERWDSRGVTISRTKTDNTDLKQGTRKSPSLEPFAKGTW